VLDECLVLTGDVVVFQTILSVISLRRVRPPPMIF
jgi:hypothetical protein